MNKKFIIIILAVFVSFSVLYNFAGENKGMIAGNVEPEYLMASSNCKTISGWLSMFAPFGGRTITQILSEKACRKATDVFDDIFANKKPTKGKIAPVELETPKITGLPDLPGAPKPEGGLAEFVAFIYALGLWIVGIAVFVQLIGGGVMWLLAAGNPSKIANAQSRMYNAIFGLILLLSSYVILNTINPNLVKPFFAICETPGDERCIGLGTGQDFRSSR